MYLNDKALYEVNSLDEVKKPVRNEKSWYPNDTLYTWFTEQDDRNNETIIYAYNFQGNNPNYTTKIPRDYHRKCNNH